MEVMIGQVLKLVNKNSTAHLEGASRKLGKLLSCQHYILLEMYMSLIALYERREEKPGETVRKLLIFSRMFQRE